MRPYLCRLDGALGKSPRRLRWQHTCPPPNMHTGPRKIRKPVFNPSGWIPVGVEAAITCRCYYQRHRNWPSENT